MSDDVLLDIADGVGTVTLNRPDRLNTLALPTVERLVGALSQAAASDPVRVVVLAGNGRYFCAGADQAEMIERDPQAWEPIVRRYLDPVRAIVGMDKPVIATGLSGWQRSYGGYLAASTPIGPVYLGVADAKNGAAPDWPHRYRSRRRILMTVAFLLMASSMASGGEVIPVGWGERPPCVVHAGGCCDPCAPIGRVRLLDRLRHSQSTRTPVAVPRGPVGAAPTAVLPPKELPHGPTGILSSPTNTPIPTPRITSGANFGSNTVSGVGAPNANIEIRTSPGGEVLGSAVSNASGQFVVLLSRALQAGDAIQPFDTTNGLAGPIVQIEGPPAPIPAVDPIGAAILMIILAGGLVWRLRRN